MQPITDISQLDMVQPQSFETKSGYCFVFPDRIILSKGTDYTKSAQNSSDTKIKVMLVVYALLALYLLYNAYESLSKGLHITSIFRLTLSFFLVTMVIKSFNNSSASVLYRSSITKVAYNTSIAGLKRPYFTVFFTDEKGKQRKRLIMLPGSFNSDYVETAAAIKVMKDNAYM